MLRKVGFDWISVFQNCTFSATKNVLYTPYTIHTMDCLLTFAETTVLAKCWNIASFSLLYGDSVILNQAPTRIFFRTILILPVVFVLFCVTEIHFPILRSAATEEDRAWLHLISEEVVDTCIFSIKGSMDLKLSFPLLPIASL